MRISIICFLCCFCGVAYLSAQVQTKIQKPNIIIILTDDQGYGDLEVYGAKDLKTPYLNQLAREGLQLTNFYVPATVCTPARAALLTGCYPKRVGLHKAVLFPFSTTGLHTDEVVIPELLKKKGYVTGCIGKWHLGHLPDFMPNEQGFDYFYGVPYSNDMDAYDYGHFKAPPLPIYKNRKKIAEGVDQNTLTKRWTTAATRFIVQHKSQPFFLYLAHNMPHLPWHHDPKFKGRSQRGVYGDVIAEIDWSVGELLKTLRANGLEENTLLIFTSDNGPVTHLPKSGSAGPLRGSKATTWEGGSRVPCLIKYPAMIPAGSQSDALSTVMDLLPTIAGITGLDLPEKKIDGHDITPILSNPQKADSPYAYFYYYARNGKIEGVRKGDWKLRVTQEKDGERIALYHLKNDVGERKNLARKYPKKCRQLLQKMRDFDQKITLEAKAKAP